MGSKNRKENGEVGAREWGELPAHNFSSVSKEKLADRLMTGTGLGFLFHNLSCFFPLHSTCYRIYALLVWVVLSLLLEDLDFSDGKFIGFETVQNNFNCGNLDQSSMTSFCL